MAISTWSTRRRTIPDANRIEWLWRIARRAVTHNHHRDTWEELQDAIRLHFAILAQHPNEVLHYIGSAFAVERTLAVLDAFGHELGVVQQSPEAQDLTGLRGLQAHGVGHLLLMGRDGLTYADQDIGERVAEARTQSRHGICQACGYAIIGARGEHGEPSIQADRCWHAYHNQR